MISKILTLIFVGFSLIYVLLLGQLNRAENPGLVNETIRPALLKCKLARTAFFLNSPGDSRYDYFSQTEKPVLVEVDYQEGKLPDENIEKWITDLIWQTLANKAEVKVGLETKINLPGPFSDEELLEMVKVTQDYRAEAGQAYLHLIYVSGSEEYSSNMGLTLTGESMFIFRDTLNSLTNQEKLWARIEESTIKHEFGHLLGLEHTQGENCVMSERVEVYENRQYQFENIPLDFCEESLDQLRKLKLD